MHDEGLGLGGVLAAFVESVNPSFRLKLNSGKIKELLMKTDFSAFGLQLWQLQLNSCNSK